MLTLAKARKLFRAGDIVTLSVEFEGTRQVGAEWEYVTVRAKGTQYRAPGSNTWQAVTPAALATDALLGTALAVLSGQRGSVAPDGATWYASARCSHVLASGRPCNRLLTVPEQVRAGVGPSCGGVYDAQNARSAARHALWQSVSLDGAPVAPPAPAAPACDGRCSLDTVCAVCG